MEERAPTEALTLSPVTISLVSRQLSNSEDHFFTHLDDMLLRFEKQNCQWDAFTGIPCCLHHNTMSARRTVTLSAVHRQQVCRLDSRWGKDTLSWPFFEHKNKQNVFPFFPLCELSSSSQRSENFGSILSTLSFTSFCLHTQER